MFKLIFLTIALLVAGGSPNNQQAHQVGYQSYIPHGESRQFYAQHYVSPYTRYYAPPYTIAPYWFSRAANPYHIYYPLELEEDSPEIKEINARIDSLLREIDRSIEERLNPTKQD